MSLLSYSSSAHSCKLNVIPNSNTILAISCCIITNCDAVTTSSACSTANGNAI